MKSLIAKIKEVYARGCGLVSYAQSPFLLLIRLYWGWQFVQTGLGKLHDLPKVINFFTSLGLPFPGPTAVFNSFLEFLGGLVLAVGLFSRPVALALSIYMFVAYVVADREALLSFLSDPDKFSAAAPFTFLFASLLILIFGPGKFSLDAALVWFSRDVKTAGSEAQMNSPQF